MNSTITLVDAQGVKKPEAVEYSGLLSDWLIENYNPDTPTKIYAGGLRPDYEIADLTSDTTEEEFLRLNMHHEKVFIVSNPLGTGFIEAFVISLLISAATALVTYILTPTPNLPEGTRQAKTSPNNGTGPQTNEARPNSRVPDVFGEDRCTPDLITAGVFEYIDHIKFIEQDFCVSRKYGLIEDVRSGETLGSEIFGFSLDIYEPGTPAPTLLKSRESNEVKTLTLNPPNDVGLKLNTGYRLYYDSINDEGYVVYDRNVFGDFGIGSTVTLEDVYTFGPVDYDGLYTISDTGGEEDFVLFPRSFTYDDINEILTISGDFSSFTGIPIAYLDVTYDTGTLQGIEGWFTVDSADATSIVFSGVTGITTSSGTFEFNSYLSGTFITLGGVSTVNSNWSSLSSASTIILSGGGGVFEPRIYGPDDVKERGPFIVPGDNNDEIWVDFQAPRGLVRDGNKFVTVNIEVFIEEVDANDNPTGPSFTIPYSFTDNTPDPRFYTRKITPSNSSLIAGNRYRITARRTSNTDVGDVSRLDRLQWARLVGIEDIATATDDTDTTRIKVKTQATEQTSSRQQSQINLRWTRKCPYWDGSQVIGDVNTGIGLVPSRRMADNFLSYALDEKLGARNISNIDLEAIYDIQDAQDLVFNGEKCEFSFTFSDANTPALEEMRQIANAARCFLTRRGSVISMVRDEEQPFFGPLFNRRNKIPFRERKSNNTNKPLDYDGVQFTYKDRSDDEEKTILIPNDLPVGDPNYGAPAAKNYKVAQGTGIRNRSQAWDRAQYEYNRLIYRRETVEDEVDEEGILLELNQRIEHTDGTRLDQNRSDGEILGVNGLVVDTSEMCIFEDGKTYSVILRSEDGQSSSAIPVTARNDTPFGFVLNSTQSTYLRGFNDYQLGTLYSFSADDVNAKSYLVQSITPTEEGTIALELINYDPRYYQADNQIAPEA